jgi:hypothetical protein
MRSIRNIQQIMGRKSFPDFLAAMNNHVDLKEWSEVGGVYGLSRNILRHFKADHIFDIGCGKRPTLGTLMALNYKAFVYCIDPQLSLDYAKNITRLFLYNEPLSHYLSKIENITITEPTLVLCNHSHVSKKEITKFLAKIDNWIYVTVPCCIDNRLSNKKCISYKDIHMHTPENDVHIYASDDKYLKELL